jgi:hypothetical protein
MNRTVVLKVWRCGNTLRYNGAGNGKTKAAVEYEG